MITALTKFVLWIAGGSKIFATLLVAFFPLIELKGAIPVGVKFGMPLWQAGLFGYVGSTLVAIPLLLLLKPIFNLLKKWPFFNRIERVFREKAENVAKKHEGKSSYNKLMFLAVVVFCAVPIPLTGVYTSAAIAVFAGLKFWPSFGAIVIGNLISGSVILLLTYIVGAATVDYILYGLLAIVVVVLAIFIFKVATSKEKEIQHPEQNV